MILKSIEMAATSFKPADIILDNRSKIVFIGRSNVGKSSLINKLVHRKKLARTSSTPGKTVSINYYLLNEEFYFVDLPGYGYAKISKQEKLRVKKLMSHFFNNSDNIKLILILIDSRRGFLDPDIDVLASLVEKNIKILTVLTKSDKIKNSVLKSQIKKLHDNFEITAIPFSIKNEKYKEDILKRINKALKE